MSEQQHRTSFRIIIDKDQFEVDQPSFTGSQLRQLPSPPIGPERDLYEEVPGPTDDRLIGDEDLVEMRNGLHFFTTPHTITPG
jgi:hypothetical protein